MNQRLSAWERLQRRWVIGERLSIAEERERLEGAREPAALEELHFYERAQRWLGETRSSEDGESARFVAQALSRSGKARSPGLRLVGEAGTEPQGDPRPMANPKTRVWLLAGGAAAVLGAAASLGLWRQASLRPGSPASASQLPANGVLRSAGCELSSTSGIVELRSARGAVVVGAVLHEGDTVTTAVGTACLTIERTVRVCLPNDSRLMLTSLRPADLRVDVQRGASLASLSPRPPGSFFSLTGNGLVATAHGTVFALELTGAHVAAEVTVFDGSVQVSNASERLLVVAGNRARFDDDGRRLPQVAVDSQMRSRWLAWLGASPVASAAPSASAQASPPEIAPASLGVASSSGERADNGLSRDALFAAARKQAGLGNARAARALYRELLTRYPGQGTASVQVVLGNLEMELEAPDRALTAFDTYLRSGGSLEPEALHGKVRALRALGRSAEESATIRTYLARYPNGFQAPMLKRRLSELE